MGAWTTPSLGFDRTVHQVLGHLTATAKLTPPRFFLRMAAAGFRFPVMTQRLIDADTAGGPAATLAEFGRVKGATSSGARSGSPTPTRWRCSSAWPTSTRVEPADRRSAAAGGAHRSGDRRRLVVWFRPEVSGPMLAIVLAMSGRTAGLDDLTGEGLGTLRAR